MGPMSPGRRPPAQSTAARDSGLRRVSRITRWSLAGGLALSGALSVVAAANFAGHSSSASAATTGGTGTATSPATVPSSPGGTSSGAVSRSTPSTIYRAPVTQVRPTRRMPSVRSGGS